MYKINFDNERKWITILYFYRRVTKYPDFEVTKANVRRYWEGRWGLSPSAGAIIKKLPSEIKQICETASPKEVKERRIDAAIYRPTPPDDKRSSWLSPEIMTMAREKGYAILKGKSKYELSGFRISLRDENGFFDQAMDRVVSGASFDLSKEEVIEFILGAKSRYQHSEDGKSADNV